MSPEFAPPRLSRAQFEKIRRLVYDVCGLNLHAGKESLVQARLAKRMRELGIRSFREYLELVEHDDSGDELSELVDALTTNKTSFFREPQHFDYLRESVLPRLAGREAPIRIWSAGCSSGEEPYTLAMVLHEALPPATAQRARILATDISTRVLASARAGVYAGVVVQDVPAPLVPRYFDGPGAPPAREYRVSRQTRAIVRLARLNLLGAWPMRGPFDVIFCRNVMIYFDRETQERLVRRFWELLEPGGHLFVGHSESLSALSHEFRYARPAVYVK